MRRPLTASPAYSRFGQKQNLRHADLHRRCRGNELRPLAGSRSSVSTVLRQISTRAPCATRLSTSLRLGFSGRADRCRDRTSRSRSRPCRGRRCFIRLLATLITMPCFRGSLSESCSTILCSANGLSCSGACWARAAGAAAAINSAAIVARMLAKNRSSLSRNARIVLDAFQRDARRRAVGRLARFADVWRRHPRPACRSVR